MSLPPDCQKKRGRSGKRKLAAVDALFQRMCAMFFLRPRDILPESASRVMAQTVNDCAKAASAHLPYLGCGD